MSVGAAHLAAIVESSDDAILSKNLDGIIQSCNAAAERMFGYTSGELIGQNVRILVPPERQEEEDMIMARLRRGERVQHFETVRLAKSGQPIDISLTVSPVRDETGAIVGASKIARDITEQKRAQAAQARLAAIVESSEDAILAKTLDGIIQSCNATAERLFGYSESELIGQSVRILIPPERQAEEDDILARIRRGERVAHFETVRVARDGRRLDVSLSISPVRDASGRVIGASKIARDITEQKRTAAALAAQQEWFRVTLESIGDAVIASDAQGRVIYMNGPAESLSGWSADEAREHPLAEVFHIVNEKTRQRVDNPADRVIRTGHVLGLANHTVLISRNGTHHPIADSAAPIRDGSGDVTGVVLVFRDVGDERRRESERRTAAAERERLLEAERTARADAEHANRAKDDFLAMVSHELRTPLNAILGWTQLLAKGDTDGALLARGLDVIARNTRVQAQLIADLLDISRIVAGKLPLAIESVDLIATIDEAVSTIQVDADDKRIVIQRDLDADVGPIAGDPARLQQIVWNLLSNAIKFTPEGGRIVVRLRQIESDVEISVSDTGMGIRAESLPHIFDRFQQADRSITRRFGGLGLGLSIVKHLVDLHGGTVKADSPGEGYGATFTIVLPSSRVGRSPDAIAPTHMFGADAAQQISLHGLRILVVEDEPDTRDVVERFLSTYGAEVVTAASAGDALAVLSSTRPDILVSDIGLPGVDGYDLIQRVRELGAEAGGGAIPAIALTAYARREDRTRALRAGYQAHLAKPIEPSELAATIASFAELVDARRKQF